MWVGTKNLVFAIYRTYSCRFLIDVVQCKTDCPRRKYTLVHQWQSWHLCLPKSHLSPDSLFNICRMRQKDAEQSTCIWGKLLGWHKYLELASMLFCITFFSTVCSIHLTWGGGGRYRQTLTGVTDFWQAADSGNLLYIWQEYVRYRQEADRPTS